MNKLTQAQFKQKLGNNITKRREELDLSQTQLAHRIGRDRQFINRYELEGANPTANILKELAEALEISIDELLDFSSEDEPLEI
jgi:transcriptional regulator with XRE-family HTH domain